MDAQMIEAAEADEVNDPVHYARWPVEPIEMIMRNGLEFWRGNIIKYVMRAGYKMGSHTDDFEAEKADLRKAQRYIQMRLNFLEGKDIVKGK